MPLAVREMLRPNLIQELRVIERIEMTARWSDAVVGGGLVFLAGHTADSHRGGSVRAQTKEVLQSMDDTLAKAGVTKKNLMMVQIFLSDISTIGEMNEAWDAWVDSSAAPARATVEARLAAPDLAVEITAIAML